MTSFFEKEKLSWTKCVGSLAFSKSEALKDSKKNPRSSGKIFGTIKDDVRNVKRGEGKGHRSGPGVIIAFVSSG